MFFLPPALSGHIAMHPLPSSGRLISSWHSFSKTSGIHRCGPKSTTPSAGRHASPEIGGCIEGHAHVVAAVQAKDEALRYGLFGVRQVIRQLENALGVC